MLPTVATRHFSFLARLTAARTLPIPVALPTLSCATSTFTKGGVPVMNRSRPRVRFLAMPIVIAFLLGLSSCKRSVDREAEDRRQVLQVLREWSDAYVTRDMKVLDRVRADDWTYCCDPSGKVLTKAEADKMLRADPTQVI